MQQYLLNLLPRLKQHSKTLDHLENFIEKPWVHIDEENGRVLYIFKRDQQLLVSINGRVTSGTWEYIKPANSILISRSNEHFLLNHAFISDGLMVLRQDGTQSHWVMINEQVIPDLNVEKYLNIFNSAQEKVYDPYLVEVHIQTEKGIMQLYAKQGILTRGLEVSNPGFFEDGNYKILNHNDYNSITLQEGKVIRIEPKDSIFKNFVFIFLVIFFIVFIALIALL